jgi:MFS family permease
VHEEGGSAAPAAPGLGADERARLQRRTLRVLGCAQVFGGASFFVGLAVAVLLARDLGGTDALAGIPVALSIAISALAALPIAGWMGRVGRRPGLVLGYAIGATGAAVTILAAVLDSYVLLLPGLAAAGIANTSNLLARYAAADLSVPRHRGRAISVVLMATTVGALAGPNLIGPGRDLAHAIDLPGLAGAYVISIACAMVAITVLTTLLRPDPLAASGGLSRGRDAVPGAQRIRVPSAVFRDPRARTGVAAMVVANLVMVSIMTMTPLYLDDHGHSLEVVGLVISLHVVAMFLPSPLTGYLCDRLGRIPVIVTGGSILIAAGAVGALASPESSALIAVALVLLGVGWNFGLIGGSTLLTDAIEPAERPAAQGAADLTMGMVGALGSLASAPLLGIAGYVVICLIGASLASALLAVLALAPRSAKAPV